MRNFKAWNLKFIALTNWWLVNTSSSSKLRNCCQCQHFSQCKRPISHSEINPIKIPIKLLSLEFISLHFFVVVPDKIFSEKIYTHFLMYLCLCFFFYWHTKITSKNYNSMFFFFFFHELAYTWKNATKKSNETFVCINGKSFFFLKKSYEKKLSEF